MSLIVPKVKKIVYSTCSIHVEENEMVIARALDVFKSDFQLIPNIFKDWARRGIAGHLPLGMFQRITSAYEMYHCDC
jgi:16S rRNA C967 or C1407 C5-methylase (RsmB/RsmF family)